jgi:hypothetical protein
LAVVDLPRERWSELEPAARQLVLDEEMRAWNLGAIELEAVRFNDWTVYHQAAVGGLAAYEQLLHLAVGPLDRKLPADTDTRSVARVHP